MGFQTHRDNFCIDDNKNILSNRLFEFSQDQNKEDDISRKYGVKSSSDFNIKKAQTELSQVNLNKEIIICSYRPFENKYIYFDRIVVDRPRKELLIHSKKKENIILGIGRQGMAVGDIEWCLTTVSKNPVDANMFRRGGVNLFPLYLYPETNTQQTLHGDNARKPNLNPAIVEQIAAGLGLAFTNEKEAAGNVCFANSEELRPEFMQSFAPIDLLDYIYAVLHSPTYREKYKEFLKIDFPRVPYPTDTQTFCKLVALGGELRQIHLLESPTIEKYITQYPEDGDNVVVKPRLDLTGFANLSGLGRVYINETQYFANVPELVWNFYIGGYLPAQKWLKDRKDRELGYEDILHYQKIIVALSETDRIMKEIETIEI